MIVISFFLSFINYSNNNRVIDNNGDRYQFINNNRPMNAFEFFDYICVIDFEATCIETNPFDFPHEIIEFPIVLVNMKTLQIVCLFSFINLI